MIKNNPKISVIVPVYNVKEYLSRCVDSILAQTFSDFELLLIDDGSKDRSAQICDDYAKKDNRVKVVHKENEVPLLEIDVNLKHGVKKKILVYDGDTAEELAAVFSEENSKIFLFLFKFYRFGHKNENETKNINTARNW